MAVRRIDTRALIEESPFGRYQASVLLLCFMAMIIDSYDVQIIGVAAAGIRETLNRLGRKTLMVAQPSA